MMPLRMSLILVLLLGLNVVRADDHTADVSSKLKFTVTTFNLKFYGLGGTPSGSSATETRDPYLENFLKDSIPASDIFVFEEIVDVPRVQKLLPSDWDCLSYENPSPTHQHVVLCHSPRFKFEREPSDDNDVIDEVAGEQNTLRPALTTIVTDKDGNKLFRIVGVHLKASPTYSPTRISQAHIISNYLEKLKGSHLPVLVTGDFNTYKSSMNGQKEDDIDLILNILNKSQLSFQRIPNELFTFRSGFQRGQFDQFYLNEMTATKPLQIYEICNQDLPNGNLSAEVATYNRTISDHCPVTAEITLK